jgi:hypothetical protein
LTARRRCELPAVRSEGREGRVQVAWKRLRAGAADVRWALYFAVALFPALAGALLIAALLGWDMSSEPGGWIWLLVAPAVAVALFFAGLRDGPRGRLGRYVWGAVLIAVGIMLLRDILRNPAVSRTREVRLAGHGAGVTISEVTIEEIAVERKGWSWRDLRRLHLQSTAGGTEYQLTAA